MNRNAELRGEHFQILKRRGVDSSLDQAEKVYGDAEQLREFLLAHLSIRTYRSEAIAEFFTETRQMNFTRRLTFAYKLFSHHGMRLRVNFGEISAVR